MRSGYCQNRARRLSVTEGEARKIQFFFRVRAFVVVRVRRAALKIIARHDPIARDARWLWSEFARGGGRATRFSVRRTAEKQPPVVVEVLLYVFAVSFSTGNARSESEITAERQ